MAESKGIKSELIPKIATGFCGGISRTCGICGAVSGSIMAIGLFTGRSNPDESVTDNYNAVQKMIGRFEEKFGSTNCQELTGCDLGTTEGRDSFKANKVMDKCKNYTEEAARIAITIIENEISDILSNQ